MAGRIALVVDDNRVNRVLALRILGKLGWQTAEADGGEAALAWLRANKADLALIDISMPVMDGIEVCRIVRRENLGGEGIKLVAYTAHALPEEKQNFIANGFDSILTKPVTRDEVVQVLREAGLNEGDLS